MGACEYEHYRGNKLAQNQLDIRESAGWKLIEHFCTADDVHSYIFKRPKEA